MATGARRPRGALRHAGALNAKLNAPTCDKLVQPTNFRAVRPPADLAAGVAAAAAPKPGGGVGGDTEGGVKVWQSRLSEKLNRASPAPVLISGGESSQEETRTLALIVADYVAGAAE